MTELGLGRDLRSNGYLTALKVAVLALVLLTIYNVSSFSASAESAVNRSFSAEAEVELYSLADTLADPDEFIRFRESKKSVSTLGEFYNGLSTSRELTFLSAFDQPLPISDFRGGEKFDVNTEMGLDPRGEYTDPMTGDYVRDVKAFQMNRATYDFYRLQVEDGSEIGWESVDYGSGTIPVLLGHDYVGIYEIGALLGTNYYSVEMDLTVVGFLEKDSSIFYKGEMNTFLDDYVVVPYPHSLEPATDDNLYFQGILYFAMINGDLVAERSMTAADVINKIGTVAAASGFDEYTLLNVPTYLVQYRQMRQLIVDNASLLVIFGLALSICVLLVTLALSYLLTRKRLPRYVTSWVVGRRLADIRRQNSLITAAEYGVLGAIVLVAVSRLPNWSFSSLTLVILIAGGLFVGDAILQWRLITGELGKNSRLAGGYR